MSDTPHEFRGKLVFNMNNSHNTVFKRLTNSNSNITFYLVSQHIPDIYHKFLQIRQGIAHLPSLKRVQKRYQSRQFFP